MDQPLEIWIPVKPYRVIQVFGANPEYYARFLDAAGRPQKGHMGMDLQASHGQPVYAPVSGDAFYVKDAPCFINGVWHPEGHGGDGIYIRSQGHTIILWHLCSKDDPKFKPLIACDGSITKVTIGQHIAFADNTGAPFESSGDHLHLGVFVNDPTGAPLNPGNGFGGCIDPAPFLNQRFAEDYLIAEKALDSAGDIVVDINKAPISVQDKVSLLSKVAQVITILLHVLELE